MTGYPTTLVEALDRLPGSANADGSLRGFRFLTTDREDRFYTYADLRAEAHRRAAILASHGLSKGDTVALVCPENHEFVLTFLGASVGGFVPVPIFPGATFKASDHYLDTLEHIVVAARSKVIVCITKNLEVIEKLKERAATKDLIVLAADRDFAGDAPAFTAPTVTPDDLCFLQFTSGSTNKPKGVAIKHRNLVANTTAFLGPDGLARTREDVGVSWLPLFHDMGLIGFVLGTLIVDLPVVLFQTSTFVRMPRLWLELITKHKGTITYAPNFAFDLLTKRVTEKDLATLDLSSLRVAGCGAEPIRARTLTDFAAKFAKCGFDSKALLPSYGMAESCLAITFHQRGTEMIVDKVDAAEMRKGKAVPSDAADALELVSCGVPFPGHELAIVDEHGNAVGERVVGQILSKGPSVNEGYFENAEATAESFKDGWLYSGDLGYRADGNVFVCGRVKDLIIVNGANHYPQDIEWVVGDLEGVRRGNVVAFSVMKDGLEALVIAAEGNSGDAARLKTDIARVVSETFGLTPAHVAICPVGALPKTSSGKAQRRKSKAMWESKELEEHP
ncbi:MAG: fatty acyl-AMP ligase [Deltaproteobacteria bacterium]|nr:fatty acyl-AMP ligase [Deltaproteobacteria bacterium]